MDAPRQPLRRDTDYDDCRQANPEMFSPRMPFEVLGVAFLLCAGPRLGAAQPIFCGNFRLKLCLR